MFELRVKCEFSAAHHLEGYPGDCARPHGHNFVVEVFARSHGTDEIGMAMDFKMLKSAVKELIRPWDHFDLNEAQDFQELNPTAENIAKISFDKLSSLLSRSSSKCWIDRVTVWENERCSATYFPECRS